MMDNKIRCFGNGTGKEFYAHYHDNEWGVPVHKGQLLFEMLILEGAQAGLRWETVLKRRSNYRKAFYNFDPKEVAAMTDNELDALVHNEGIIRNRLKIYSARHNAQIFIKIQEEFGTFDNYVWKFVGNKTITNQHHGAFRTTSKESDLLAKDLKKCGMNFVGSTIIYAFMQAVGMVNCVN